MFTPTTGAQPIATRAFATLSGAALVAAAAWLTIEATGGPTTSHAKLIAATAIALVAGAVALRHAHGATYAAVLAGLLCAEAYSLIGTGERLIAARDAAEAPRRAAEAPYNAAVARVAKAETAAAGAAAAALAKAGERDCQKHCRALLEQAKAEAAAEIAAARTALDRMTRPAEAAPLAARLGLAPWVLDLVVAALGSLAANGLGCALIAFGVHAPVRAGDPDDGDSRQTDFPRPGTWPVDPLPPAAAPKPVEREQKVRQFVEAYRARHGRDPAPREVRAATGLPRSTAHRYQRRVACA